MKFFIGDKSERIPRPAVSGYLDVISGVVNSGRLVTATVQQDLIEIGNNELELIEKPSEGDETPREPSQGSTIVETAQYNLGRLAAVFALLDDGKKDLGFKLRELS